MKKNILKKLVSLFLILGREPCPISEKNRNHKETISLRKLAAKAKTGVRRADPITMGEGEIKSRLDPQGYVGKEKVESLHRK